MDTEKFEQSVRHLANQRVNQNIEIFERVIMDAFEKLTGTRFLENEEDKSPDPNRLANTAILELFVEEQNFRPKKGWPAYLWEAEEKKVRKELFKMMDVVQKALLAPEPRPDDCTPKKEDNV